jgi:hypothetical protein
MKLSKSLVLPAMLAAGLFASVPCFGCSAGPCADGTTCTGNKSCSCAGGTATCTDYQQIEQSVLTTAKGLSAYSSYLGRLNSSEARSLQEAADAMKLALDQNSLADYFAARARHDATIKKLSAEDWKALAAGGFLADKGPRAEQ